MAVLELLGAIRTALVADPDLSALVGSRVYAVERQSDESPAVVYSLASVSNEFEMGDDLYGVTDVRAQFDCIASDRLDSATAVFTALNAVMGTLHGDHAGGVTIQSVRRENVSDLSDLSGQQKTYRITADYIIGIVEE